MILSPSVAMVPGTTPAVAESVSQIDQVRRAAVRTLFCFRIECCVQQMATIVAPNQVSREMDLTPFDPQMLSLDKELSHLSPGFLHKA